MLKQIENYYNGNKAYLLFLRSELTGNDEYKNFILEKNYQIAAVVANLSSLLLSVKEDVVKNEGELVYSSKVFDDCLINSINIIGTIQKDEVIIDNYKFTDKGTLVASIRNKIAHGDFKIDFDNNLLILNIKNSEVKIDIDKLSIFVVSAFQATIKDYKSSKYERNILSFKVKDRTRKKPLTVISDFRNIIKSFSCTRFEIVSDNGAEIDKKTHDLFEYFLNIYKESPKAAINNPIYQEMLKYLKSKNCTLRITEERIKDKELIAHLEEYAKMYILGHNFSYEAQIRLMGMEIAKYFDDTSKFDNALSYSKNLMMLKTIRSINSVDHKKISTALIKSGYDDMIISYNELAGAIINMFMSLYIYPFESLYMPTKEYSFEKKDLDFSQLDTSLFNVQILNINDNPLKEMKARCDSCLKNVVRLTESVEKCKQNLENVRKLGNQKVIAKIEAQIQNLNNELTSISKIASETKREYDLMQTDYLNNSNFFRNEAIINGIRNSIAHGNYEVIGNPEPTIVFKDIYEGDTTFKAFITLANFYTFVDSNSKILFDFIKKKQNEKVV